MKKTAIALTAAAVTAFAAAQCRASKGNTEDVPDIILILGHRLIDNKADEILELRIKKAAEYLESYPQVIAIACGGKTSKEQTLTEAEVIAAALKEKGIAPERIILEDRSSTTRENFINAGEIIKKLGIENPRVAMLSSEYHLLRGSLLAKKCSLNVTTIAAPIPEKDKIKSYIREFICFPELIKK